jgi:hypothetical protein
MFFKTLIVRGTYQHRLCPRYGASATRRRLFRQHESPRRAVSVQVVVVQSPTNSSGSRSTAMAQVMTYPACATRADSSLRHDLHSELDLRGAGDRQIDLKMSSTFGRYGRESHSRLA